MIKVFFENLLNPLLIDVLSQSWVMAHLLPGIGLGSLMPPAGNTKGGIITVPLTSCLTGLELAV